MVKFTSSLDDVKIAAPCPSDWDAMLGDERVRFCGQCRLNVYNLSDMSKAEAESLISRTEGRLCVRYYRRRDGSILTNNCPVGLRAIKRRVSRIASATFSAVLSFFAGLGLYAGMAETKRYQSSTTMGTIAISGPDIIRPAEKPGQTVGQMVVMEESASRTNKKGNNSLRLRRSFRR
jgi:hypothetical protein